MKWMCNAAAPWALGIGLIISFTAEAGNRPRSGVSLLARDHMAQLTENVSIDQSNTVLRRQSYNVLFDGGNRAAQASLRSDLRLSDDHSGFELPKGDLKKNHGAFPEVNRASKKAAAGNIPETLSRRALDLKKASVYGSLAFARDERVLPPMMVMRGQLDIQPGLQTFQPDDDEDEFYAYLGITSLQSPLAAASGSTGSGVTVGMGDGSTPQVSRAVVLSSATPAPIDEIPTEIAAAPVSFFGGKIQIDDRRAPDYASLVNSSNMDSEKKCLAEAVYFEARSEPPEGQAAVAQVVLNRVRSGLYPKTICGVVFQNRNRHLACQFTFACEGKALRISESESWTQAQRIADSVLEGKTYLSDVGGATHYHADYVRPYWAKRLQKMDVIGRHIFYKLRPGQT